MRTPQTASLIRTPQTRFPSASPSASLGASAHQGFGQLRPASALGYVRLRLVYVTGCAFS